MPNKCIIPGCNTDYATCKVKLSMFSSSKDDERRKEWKEKLQLIKPLLAETFCMWKTLPHRRYNKKLQTQRWKWQCAYRGKWLHIFYNIKYKLP